MTGPFISKRLALLSALTLLILGGTGQFYPSVAQDAAQFSSSQSKMMDLGSEFMRSIGNSLRQSNLYLAGAGKFQLAEQKSGSIIPNNETLILHAVIGRNSVSGRQDIFAVKKSDHLMISLADLVLAMDLQIKVNSKAGTASGWFGRQTQTFELDLNKPSLTVSGKPVAISSKDFEQSEQDILVNADALEKWFTLSFDYDLSGLNLIILTAELLPIETAFIRSQKGSARRDLNLGAKLPPLEPEYSYASLPYIDVELGANVFQSPGTRRIHNEDWSTIITGDYAGFNTSAYLNGTSLEPYLSTARVTMGKEDPQANLLGPLHASKYSFGDVNSVGGSLIGSTSQERGVYVTNRLIDRDTAKTYTEIKGDSHPGWDIELYRNGSYLDIRHVEADGRYDFGKVDLLVGQNDFKLIFFSPQGEQIEEHKLINVDAASLGADAGRYAVSLTQNGKSVYSRTPQTGIGTGGPHFGGSYNFGIKGFGTATAGISSDIDDGTRRTFLESSLATAFLDTFYNATIGYDTSNASYGTVLTARRNFGNQSVRIEYNHNMEGFNSSAPNTGAGVKDSYGASMGGPLLSELFFLNNISYNTGTNYSQNYGGSTSWQSNFGLTSRVKNVSFNAGVQYVTSSTPPNPDSGNPGSTNEAFNSNFGMRGAMFGGSWRLGAQYEILPRKQLTSVDLDYTRPIADNLDSTTSITYDPQTKYRTISVGLNWLTSKAVISPRIQYDNNKNIAASVNAHFGLAADPYLSNIRMTGAYVTSSGGVAARIFQDNNGNGIFDDGDVLLPDAEITAIQGQTSASANEDGIAFIPDLPKNVRTDITVNPGASEAQYGVSLFKGVAIMPHPGAVTKLEFPIVNSGEIDGQAYVLNDKGESMSARGLGVTLTTPDGRVHKAVLAESDGYWAMSSIEPGVYYLTARADEVNSGYFVPRMLEYKPDGTMLFGQEVRLKPGYTTNFRFTASNASPDGANHARVIRSSDIATQRIQLEIGSFHSRLAMTLAWYKIKILGNKIPGGLDLAMPMAGMPRDPETDMGSLVLKPNTIASAEQGAAACQALGDLHLGSCTVNVITTYRGLKEETVKPYREPPKLVAAKQIEEQQPEEKQADMSPEPVVMITPVAAAPQAKPQNNQVVERADTAKAVTTTAISPALAADLADYVAVNPALNKSLLKEKIVILNLGSYNSRALMTVIWFKIRTRYAGMIGDAQLLVQPTDSNASAQTGKYTLRASLPVFNVEEANKRCDLLTAQGQACTVEVLPSGLQASR